MKKKDPVVPMGGIASMSLVCLTGVLGLIPRDLELKPMQLASLGLSILALLGINIWGYRLYRYCKHLLAEGA